MTSRTASLELSSAHFSANKKRLSVQTQKQKIVIVLTPEILKAQAAILFEEKLRCRTQHGLKPMY
ncbi:MAG: hypothetical protein AABZ18_05640 [Pseudomonadota bacterium]